MIAIYRPPKRTGELYRIVLNFRYVLIRWRSGKAYVFDGKTGCPPPENVRKTLLEAERNIIRERFGEESPIYKLIVKRAR